MLLAERRSIRIRSSPNAATASLILPTVCRGHPTSGLGVSVESDRYGFRVEHLRRVPAAVRFVSAEPLLGPVTMDLFGIDWLIAGGESGPGARPMRSSWVRGLRDQCIDADVAFFFKQWGGRTPKNNGRMLDGRVWDEFPIRIEEVRV